MTIDLTQFAEPEQEKGFKWWAGKKPTIDLKEFAEHPDYGYGLRQNGTQKGKGYFGEIPLEGENKGIMTELGSEMDVGDQRIHYPLIVPTLNKEEIDLLKRGEKPTEAIQKKAQEHAIRRISQGLDPFASVEEEGKTPLPKEKTQIDKYLEMPREEFMKLPINERQDIAKQIGEKGKEEFDRSIGRGAIPGYALLERKMIEKGYIEKPKVLSETQQAFGEAAGSMLPVSIMGKGIDLITKGLFPLNKAAQIGTTIGGWAVAGAAYQSLTDWEKTGKTPTVGDILKHGAFWGGTEAAIQSLPYIGKFAKQIIQSIKRSKPKTLEEAVERINTTLDKVIEIGPKGIKEAEKARAVEAKPVPKEKILEVNPKYDREKIRIEPKEESNLLPKDIYYIKNLSEDTATVFKNRWNKYFDPKVFDKIYKQTIELYPFSGNKYFNYSLKPKIGEQIGVLGDFIQGKEAREFLKDVLHIPVKRGRILKGKLGEYNNRTKEISILNNLSPEGLLRTLLHEGKHALQDLHPGGYPFREEVERFPNYWNRPHEIGARQFEREATQDIENYRKTVQKAQQIRPKTESVPPIESKLSPEKVEPIKLEKAQQKRVRDSISFGEGPKPETEKKGKFSTFYTDIVDKFYPLKKFVQGIAGVKDLPISKDPYKQARLFQGINGKVETFLHYKTLDPITLKFNGKGLSEILKPVKKDLEGFSEYLVAKRALELEQAGKKTGVNLADANRVVEEGAGKYEKHAQEIYDYQKRVLDYAEKQGLISPELRQQWEGMYQNYVPFKRVIEDGENTYFGSSMQPKSPFYRLEGSERPIVDPLQSIIGNTYLTLRAADQNQVITSLVNLSKEKEKQIITGLSNLLEERPMTAQDLIDAFKESNIFDDGKVKYFENGISKTYKLPEEVADAVKGLKSQEFGLLNKILSYPTRLVRTGAITLSPGTLFKLATVDQLEAFLYTNVGYIPYVDMVKGLFKAFKKPEMYWQWKAAGGDQSLARELSRATKEQKLKQVAGIRDTKNVIKSPDEILRKFEEASAPLEKSTRLAVFEKALKRKGMSGDDLREAALMSREATLDFARKGAKTKLMNQAIPFFNAAIQGADKFFRAVKDNPKMLWKAGATVTLPTLGLHWLNKDNKKYQELPDWEKNGFWHMYIPYMGKELHFKIAKPFELGMVFGNVPERIAEYAYKKDKSSLEQIPKSLWDTFTPSFTPAVAEPILEYQANKSLFTGAPIIPQRLEKMTPADQIGPYTSETAKKLGKILSNVPYIGDTKVASPIMIDHWLNSMTGGAGSTFVALTEKMLRNTGITPERIDPEKELADLPVLKSFFGKEGYTAQSKSIQQFYDEVEKMEGKSKALRLAKQEHRLKDAERLMKEVNPVKLKYAQKIKKAFSKSFSAIRNIQIDEEHYNSAEKKILIDQLIRDMVGTARSYLGKD